MTSGLELNAPPDRRTLQASYDRLFEGWMGQHHNVEQGRLMLDLLDVVPGRILADVACGMGDLLRQAAARGLIPYGLDISGVAIAGARSLVPTARLLVGDGEQLPWPDACFDYVTSLGSLEHYVDPAAGAQELARVLKPDGQAAILVPNSHHLKSIYNVWRFGEVLSDRQEFERFATRREWQGLLEQNGLEVRSVHKHNYGMPRVLRQGREWFWFGYNAFFHLFGSLIPLNLSDAFIFICRRRTAPEGGHVSIL